MSGYTSNATTRLYDLIFVFLLRGINIGVYKAGFATSQEPYDKAVRDLFAALDRVEEILSSSRYLTGSTITEADVRLYTSLVRFDMVYVGHFKVLELKQLVNSQQGTIAMYCLFHMCVQCNKKRIIDYPNIWGYLRDLYQTKGFGETTNRVHIEHGYQVATYTASGADLLSVYVCVCTYAGEPEVKQPSWYCGNWTRY